ncbi:MAG: ferrochelatase [Pseudomonadota bacterium]
MKNNSKTGVLLVNLGTPDAPDAASIRRFLREFLSDPRVVEIPRIIWMLILHLFVLPFRPPKLVKAYQAIWTEDGSPLLSIAYKQQKKLEQLAPDYLFATAMCYGNPSIRSALDNFKKNNIDKLLILPLYPQYSGSTSAAIFDVISNQLQQWRNIPELRMIKDYHNHPLYIQALASSIEQHWNNNSEQSKNSENIINNKAHLLMSFHGIPIDYCKKGDPYDKHCQQTARLLAKALQLSDNQWTLSYQSLFGKAEWLKPYTNITLKQMPDQGINTLDVICPGFSNDCLETLEEIKVENKEIFISAGGEDYNYISALNDSDNHIKMILELIKQHSQGW